MLHRILASIWGWRRLRKTDPLRLMLLAIVLLALAPHPLYAAVTLAEFGAVAQTTTIRIYWETASEVNMSVFYVLRGLSTTGTFTRISDFIPAEGDLAGASYEYIDRDVVAGTMYYYQLEAVETNGSSEFHGPVSARIPLPGDTNTPTPSPTPTSTPTPTTQPDQPTATPTPFVRFWADQTTVQAGQCVTLQWETREISAVFLDGVGVPGVSGRTVCPCVNETHVLRVSYRDGSSQDFTVALSVQGVCTPAAPGSTATPTFPPPATITPRPEETLQPPVDNTGTATPRIEPITPTSIPGRTPESPQITESTPTTTDSTTGAPEAIPPTPTLARPALGGSEGRAPSTPSWLWGGIGAGGLLILAGGLGIWWIRKRS